MAEGCLLAIRYHLLLYSGVYQGLPLHVNDALTVVCPLLSASHLRYPCRAGIRAVVRMVSAIVQKIADVPQSAWSRQSLVSKEWRMLDSQLDLLQQHLIVEKGLARNTLAAYMSDLQHFCAFARACGASTFQDLTRADLITYLA